MQLRKKAFYIEINGKVESVTLPSDMSNVELRSHLAKVADAAPSTILKLYRSDGVLVPITTNAALTVRKKPYVLKVVPCNMILISLAIAIPSSNELTSLKTILEQSQEAVKEIEAINSEIQKVSNKIDVIRSRFTILDVC